MKLNKILSIISIGIVLSSFSFSKVEKVNASKVLYEKPYMIVGQMPQFPGGKIAMQRYIGSNLSYPQDAWNNNIQGKVIVAFVVDKNGALTEITTVGTKLGHGLEEQAIKVFNAMPKWSPGKQDGIAVPVYMMIPLMFTI